MNRLTDEDVLKSSQVQDLEAILKGNDHFIRDIDVD
jgi:hypothetical protein